MDHELMIEATRPDQEATRPDQVDVRDVAERSRYEVRVRAEMIGFAEYERHTPEQVARDSEEAVEGKCAVVGETRRTPRGPRDGTRVTPVHDDEAARLSIERAADGDTVVFELAGDLDPHTAPLLDAELEGASATEIVLDLSGVTFIDSSGLRSIVSCHERLAAAGGSLILRRPSEFARRVLDIAGLEAHLHIE